MSYRVTIRINTETGEFDVFQVDALDATQRGTAHNAAHEEAATELGNLLERRSLVEEIPVGGGDMTMPAYHPAAEEETVRARDTQQQEGA